MVDIDTVENKNIQIKKYDISTTELESQLNEIVGKYDYDSLIDGSEKAFVDSQEINSIIIGNIVSITDETILVDYGAKVEGILPYHDDGFKNDDLDISDRTYFIIKNVDDDGLVRLTRKNIETVVLHQKVLDQLKINDKVRVILTSHTKNGWIVDLDGLAAFLPTHQEFLTYPPEGPEALCGCEVDAEIESMVDKQVVVSRKIFATDFKKKAKKDFINSLNVGDVVEGTIKNRTEFGVFIQIASGIIGLCHASDQGDSDIKIGQKTKARILKIDRDKNRVSLGIRQITEPSWSEIVNKYSVDDKVVGKVKSIVSYGAFLEIESGVSGLIHVSDLSWSDHVKHPKEVLSEGQQIEVIILGIDADKQHLSLGLKQTTQDPWEFITDKYLVGSEIDGIVTNKTKFGIFIEIEKGVEGLAHHTVTSKNLKIGEKITCSVVRIDLDKKKLSLAIEE